MAAKKALPAALKKNQKTAAQMAAMGKGARKKSSKKS